MTTHDEAARLPGVSDEVPGLKRLLWASEIQQARTCLDALESYATGRGDDEGARSYANCIRKVLAEVLSRAQTDAPREAARLPDSPSVSQDAPQILNPRGWRPDREALARIIDPEAFAEQVRGWSWDNEDWDEWQWKLSHRRTVALSKADQIIALPLPGGGGGDGSSRTMSTDAPRFAAAEGAQRKSEGGAS